MGRMLELLFYRFDLFIVAFILLYFVFLKRLGNKKRLLLSTILTIPAGIIIFYIIVGVVSLFQPT